MLFTSQPCSAVPASKFSSMKYFVPRARLFSAIVRTKDHRGASRVAGSWGSSVTGLRILAVHGHTLRPSPGPVFMSSTPRNRAQSALVTFSPEQMFDLAVDVERYPQFLPRVAGAEVHEKTDHDLLASLEMRRAGVRERFTTRNVMNRPGWMTLKLGAWAVSPAGGQPDGRSRHW